MTAPTSTKRPVIARRLILGAALLALGACATVTPYQPSVKGRPGFTDTRLEAAKFRVTFEGNTSTDLATIENYVLYRAAEVTIANGDDYFVILDQNRDAERTFRTTGTSFGGGFGRFRRRGFFYGGRFGRGFGGGFSSSSTTRERRAFTVGVVIETHKGDKPASNALAYDARQIIANIGSTLVTPDAS